MGKTMQTNEVNSIIYIWVKVKTLFIGNMFLEKTQPSVSKWRKTKQELFLWGFADMVRQTRALVVSHLAKRRRFRHLKITITDQNDFVSLNDGLECSGPPDYIRFYVFVLRSLINRAINRGAEWWSRSDNNYCWWLRLKIWARCQIWGRAKH